MSKIKTWKGMLIAANRDLKKRWSDFYKLVVRRDAKESGHWMIQLNCLEGTTEIVSEGWCENDIMDEVEFAWHYANRSAESIFDR